ncbi:adenylate/guanylate cyclase domain-containing protein [Terrarubrum flagellatum]|uniref:adenylate/guanylate cyclase domain-containing protein n=1 Tax=Terrirubrum flagellatum TaxID=2895980 RepID=UPI003145325E
MPTLGVNIAVERTLRLSTGLLLFAYAITHFISHATGLFFAAGIQAIGHDILLAPWRSKIGLSLLLVSFIVHAALGLRALYRRRHFQMPAIEAIQLGLGLVIPLLLIPHATNVRLGEAIWGLNDSYFRILYLYWITDPAYGLVRQFLLLLAVWTHGCLGLHMLLRYRRWHPRWAKALLAVAIAIPALAIFGLNNAGWSVILRATTDPAFAGVYGPPAPGTSAATGVAGVAWLTPRLQLGWIAIVAIVFLLRFIRDLRERRANSIRVRYSDGQSITAPRGFSILEVSRWGRRAHASVCGGRARCTTCRVRVLEGFEQLGAPGPAEASALQRIGAPERVRLACQVRPMHDVAVAPLLAPGSRQRLALGFDLREGRELLVTALHVDLRDSTRLAAGRLPYDALFIVDRYIQATTGAIQAHGGHITSVAGDGVMAVFGVDGDARVGARSALAAAAALWRAIETMNASAGGDSGPALRFGIGVHSGLSVVGLIGLPGQATLQFLGDTGNVAARLEALTKEMDCTMIISEAALEAAALARPDWRAAEVSIRGRDGEPIAVRLISSHDELDAPKAPALAVS